MALPGIIAGATALGNLFGSGSSQRTSQTSKENLTETFSRGSTDVSGLLNRMIAAYDPESAEDISSVAMQTARQDVAGIVDSIFRDYQDTALPEIYTAQRGAGVYGSSGAQELAERGYARAVSDASEITVAQANVLANQQLSQQQAMQQMITTLFGIDLEQEGTSTRRGTTTSTGRSSGRSPTDFTGIGSALIKSMTPGPGITPPAKV